MTADLPIPGGAGTGAVPPGVRELITPAWRLWVQAVPPPDTLHLVHVTATAENFPEVCARLRELQAGGIRILATRVARDPATVTRLNALPEWTGKAITFYLGSRDEALALAGQADSLLAGRGWYGPPALRARPYGGLSGLVFMGAAAGDGLRQAGDGRRDRLAALVDGPGV